MHNDYIEPVGGHGDVDQQRNAAHTPRINHNESTSATQQLASGRRAVELYNKLMPSTITQDITRQYKKEK